MIKIAIRSFFLFPPIPRFLRFLCRIECFPLNYLCKNISSILRIALSALILSASDEKISNNAI